MHYRTVTMLWLNQLAKCHRPSLWHLFMAMFNSMVVQEQRWKWLNTSGGNLSPRLCRISTFSLSCLLLIQRTVYDYGREQFMISSKNGNILIVSNSLVKHRLKQNQNLNTKVSQSTLWNWFSLLCTFMFVLFIVREILHRCLCVTGIVHFNFAVFQKRCSF